MSTSSLAAEPACRTPARTIRAGRWRAVTAAALLVAIDTSARHDAKAQAIEAVVSQACADLPQAEALLAELDARRTGGAECGTAGRFDAAAPLHWDDRLARMADRQAAAVAQRRSLSHHIDGADLGSRLRAVTYEPAHAAENLAAGPATWSAAVSRWMASAPHCANLMAPRLLDVGVGCAIGDDAGPPMRYWALVLGEPQRAVDTVAQTASVGR